MNKTVDEYKERLIEAKLAFDKNDERAKTHMDQLKTFSSDAMKAPALVSAAGVAAALGFYSANYSILVKNPENLITFNNILFWLFLSLLSVVCAPGMAYFSQLSYTSSIYSETYSYEPPYTQTNRKTRLYVLIGDFCRWGAVVIVIFSIICLIRGGYLFLRLI